MPIYEYRCEVCGHEFEKLVSISAPPPPCPSCAGEVRKRVSAASFVLKGSGWYKDHYGLKKGESKTESKPEAKPETKADKPKASSEAA